MPSGLWSYLDPILPYISPIFPFKVGVFILCHHIFKLCNFFSFTYIHNKSLPWVLEGTGFEYLIVLEPLKLWKLIQIDVSMICVIKQT